MMVLGDIIRVEDANTYLVKIPPDAQKECIGRLVKIKKDYGIIVGVIKNIAHIIREELIPYIDPGMQPKYAPFNEDFRNSYYTVHGLGIIRNGVVKYSIDSPPDIGDKLSLLGPDELREFHTINGKPSIAYLQSNRDALDRAVLLGMVEQVEMHYTECSAMLRLVRKYIERGK
ncbi:MAG: hypothetical protein M5U10_09335 [Candidatus Methanoperedens sp.]|nr:hypothetical protein [Candidatus Methanoperedens nitroreducens]MDJ1422103.1 hypothetical protein [Candidatus Methanoperedens sp.]